ncbi:hypothetical protein TEA_029371 [Camellia sinensis var. sinensis]|uniref:Uncharacterized protein n=1 Tax=Camellia sinensis var. sinensis TaxID=542762 RepID=A0A4S4DX86_CAMSN|nr:hypothetical protein TEA_029371 [Camellia sinensis var. sinensis]
MSKESYNRLAHSDYTHTSTSQPSSQKPRSQPPLLAPSSSLATTSLPSSHPTSGLATSNSTLTRCGQGYARAIKEWNTGDIDLKLLQLGALWPTSYDGADTLLADTTPSIDGYNWQLFDEPESLQATELGYFQTYGGDAPQSAVYRHGVGPSLASLALTMVEITQQVWEKLMREQASMIVQNTQQMCEKLKRELREELTTHIKQMTN